VGILVLKFGGTSVSKKSNWNNIASIVQERLTRVDKVVIVCSALTGISTKLENLTKAAALGDYQTKLLEIKKIHQEMLSELHLDFEKVLGERFREFEKLLSGISILGDDGPKNWARVLSYGEIFSTLLGSAYLEKLNLKNSWLDVREHMKASEYEDGSMKKRYLEAICPCDPDEKLQSFLKSSDFKVYITQGFIAKNAQNETVLLGRGGSDVSASYLAAKLQSPWLEIWTDVPGMFTANPKAIPHARLLKELSYDEAQEIASTGAKVLHPRCIAPVQIHKIPLHVYSTERPELQGTIISNSLSSTPRVKAISLGMGITVISMNTLGMWQQAGFLANAFACFKKWGLSINQVSTAETNVTVALDTKLNQMDEEVLQGLLQDLSKYCQVDVISNCATVALVGKSIRHILHDLAPAFKTFEEHKIFMLSQSSTDLNLTCVVEEAQAEKLCKDLHQFFFKEGLVDPTFGPMWSEIFSTDTPVKTSFVNNWWALQGKELIQKFTKVGATPVYAYSLDQVSKACERLKKLTNVDRFLYAVKANNNETLLKEIEKFGFGFECVSLEEVCHVFKIFPKINPKRILFTPNFTPRNEYEKAFELGVHVTLDGIYPLEAWPTLFKGKEVFVRVDLGIGRGHHPFVCTAGNESKFGVPIHQMTYLKTLAEKNNLSVVGLHAHAGSGILSSTNWFEMGQALLNLVHHFPNLRYIDLGGGLGVPYKRGDRPLDLEQVSESLSMLKDKKGILEFWVEPGRYIVADAGVLIAKVTQIKPKGDQFYVGIETGMNSLIRPALYGAYHEIVNLSKLDDPTDMICNIVGPICESGDILGTTRKLPSTTKEGDLILIATAGAYGKVMSSHYTMRGPAREDVIYTNRT